MRGPSPAVLEKREDEDTCSLAFRGMTYHEELFTVRYPKDLGETQEALPLFYL